MADAMGRRDLLKIAAAAASAGALGAAPTPPPRFFNAADFAILDELSEILIPADAHSPGARAAAAAAYIDARLEESPDAKLKDEWRAGIRLVDQWSAKMHGQPFLKLAPEQRVAVVERLAANEKDAKTPEELFFVEVKRAVIHAYYTSKIGIHQEMEYKGNVYLEQFAGIEVK